MLHYILFEVKKGYSTDLPTRHYGRLLSIYHAGTKHNPRAHWPTLIVLIQIDGLLVL